MLKKFILWSVSSALVIVALTVLLIVMVNRASTKDQANQQVTAQKIEKSDATQSAASDGDFEVTTDKTAQEEDGTQTEEILGYDKVWTTDAVNLRSAANTDSDVLTKIPEGKKVEAAAGNEGWAQVIYDGKTGFVKSEYLTDEKPKKKETRTATKHTGGRIVVIDPGHQSSADTSQEPLGPGSSTTKMKVTGGTSGTTTGVAEYQMVLEVGKKLRTELQNRGYTVYMTRESNDVRISNAERAQYANQKNADIYIRLHANGANGTAAHGAIMLYPTANNQWVGSLSAESKRLSTDVGNAYCATTGMKNLGLMPRDDMTGFNWAKMPMTLIELGFMTNPSDDRNMEDASFQAKMVTGMADGIDKYFAG